MDFHIPDPLRRDVETRTVQALYHTEKKNARVLPLAWKPSVGLVQVLLDVGDVFAGYGGFRPCRG
jgi:hypothetical protein